MRDGRDVALRVLELVRVARVRRFDGPREEAVGGQDEEDGGISDRLGARGCRVAVRDAVLGEQLGVDPVEACAGGCEDAAALRKQGADASVTDCVWY